MNTAIRSLSIALLTLACNPGPTETDDAGDETDEPREQLFDLAGPSPETDSTGDSTEGDPEPMREQWCVWCDGGELRGIASQGAEACQATGELYGVAAQVSWCSGVPILGNFECDVVCAEPPPEALCCTCPDLATSVYTCLPWDADQQACEVAHANALGEPTHWCTSEQACLAEC